MTPNSPFPQDKLSDEAIADFHATVRYVGLSATEIYFPEQRSDIRSCLFNLLPDLRGTADINAAIDTLGTWVRAETCSVIGRIQRENKYLPVGPLRTMPNLPEEIEHIDVAMHTHLGMPSLVFLAFHVEVTEAVTKRIGDHLGAVYTARPEQSQRFPGRNSVYFRNPALNRRDDIDCYLSGVRSKIIDIITASTRNGQLSTLTRTLPVVEILSVRGLPLHPEDEWFKRTRPWRNPMGLDLEFYGFGGPDGVILQSKSRDDKEGVLPWRLLIDTGADDHRNESLARAQWNLPDFLSLTAIADYEEAQQQALLEYRTRMKKLARSWLMSPASVSESASLFATLNEASEILRRVGMESDSLSSLRGGYAAMLDSSYQSPEVALVIEPGWLQRSIQRSIKETVTSLQASREYASGILNARNSSVTLLMAGLSLIISVAALLVSTLILWHHDVTATTFARARAAPNHRTPMSLSRPARGPR